MKKDQKKKPVTTPAISKSPAELIAVAVESKADLQKLEGLLTLQERYEANQAKKAYHASMAEFKANPPQIDKDRKVKFDTSKGRTEYKHATLANITDKIGPALSKYGLSVSWSTKQNGNIMVTCKITHVLGHSEETTLSAAADTSGSKNPIQAIGSAITYLQRYTLLALTGLAAHDQDDDGVGINQSSITEEERQGLNDWITKAGVKDADVLKLLKVESLDNITKRQLNIAITALKTRAKKNENN